MIGAETRQLVDGALRDKLGSWGYAGYRIEDRRDHDGDPALYIVAEFHEPSQLPPSAATIDAMAVLRERLLGLGDERLPYLDYDYPAETPASDEAA